MLFISTHPQKSEGLPEMVAHYIYQEGLILFYMKALLIYNIFKYILSTENVGEPTVGGRSAVMPNSAQF
jgi:hypothetical protein